MKGVLTSLESGSETHLTNVVIVGRDIECNLIVPDPKISRRHAMIRQQEGGYWLFDLGSFNGNHINGKRVTSGQSLTRTLGREILATREFIDACPALGHYAENLGVHAVKGRAESVEVWGFHSFPEPPPGLKL